MMTVRRNLRSAAGAALVMALLMPALRARAVMADQFADATAPVDDPKTPCPDLYAGRNFDLIPDMPDPVAMDVAAAPRPLARLAPVAIGGFVDPARPAERAVATGTARAPPAR